MKKKIFMWFIIVLVLSFFAAKPTGSWLSSRYTYSVPFFGPNNPQNLEGFLYSYIFLSALLITVLSNKIKKGFYFALPVFLFMIFFGSAGPKFWLSLILLAAGLGIAYLILLLTRKLAR